MKTNRIGAFTTFGFRVFGAFLGIAILCSLPLQAATLIWGGMGATANWSDSGNWFGLTPASGDTLVFQGGQPKLVNTNDIAGLTLNQIRFVGASGGYVISGNALTFTNASVGIDCTNTAGINRLNNAITISTSNLVVNVATPAKLVLFGGISGPGGFIKKGGRHQPVERTDLEHLFRHYLRQCGADGNPKGGVARRHRHSG